jgi:hypothetical protein
MMMISPVGPRQTSYTLLSSRGTQGASPWVARTQRFGGLGRAKTASKPLSR